MEQIEIQASDLRYLAETMPLPSGTERLEGAVLSPRPVDGSHLRRSGSRSSSAAIGDNSAFSITSHVHAHGHAHAHAATTITQPPVLPPFSPDPDDSGTSSKRKADPSSSEPNAKQQRSKRNRYISIACNECKRRKIKCNGETPCQRCGNLNLACLYSANCCSNNFRESEEYKQMNDQIRRLDEQLASLQQTVQTLRHDTQRLVPLQERLLPMPAPSTVPASPASGILSQDRHDLAPIRTPPIFHGPTSFNFAVGVAKNTLRNMGYNRDRHDDQDHDHSHDHDYSRDGGGTPAESSLRSPSVMPQASSHEETPAFQPYRQQQPNQPQQQPSNQKPSLPPDPLWTFDLNEMIRLCELHEDEIGVMHPVTRIETTINHARMLWKWMDAAIAASASVPGRYSGHSGQSGSSGNSGRSERSEATHVQPPNYEETMVRRETLLLKVVLCSGLTVEEHGRSERAIRLYATIQPIIDRKLMTDASDIGRLPLLALVAGYRYLSNDEVLAWRIMGQVARLCLEQGLHRREGLAKIVEGEERKNAINTFWSAYVLERRWSFATGLPYVVQDDMIDPGLPRPDHLPYLVAMISYSQLAAKVWRLVDVFEPALVRNVQGDEFEALDREVLKWYETVPEEVRVSGFESDLPLPQPGTQLYNLHRLQVWTYLRLHQMRIWIYTPVLHSASSIIANMALAQRAVNLAKDTIRYLSRLNSAGSVYHRIQVFYHQFLTYSLAVLFLASTHQPVQFSAQCRDEFYLALDIVRDMSAESWVSQRLWRLARSLEAYAGRVGLAKVDDKRSRPVSRSGEEDGSFASNLSADVGVGVGIGIVQPPQHAQPHGHHLTQGQHATEHGTFGETGTSAASLTHFQAISDPWMATSASAVTTPTFHGHVHPPSSSLVSSAYNTGRQSAPPDPTHEEQASTSPGGPLQTEIARIFEGLVGTNEPAFSPAN